MSFCAQNTQIIFYLSQNKTYSFTWSTVPYLVQKCWEISENGSGGQNHRWNPGKRVNPRPFRPPWFYTEGDNDEDDGYWNICWALTTRTRAKGPKHFFMEIQQNSSFVWKIKYLGIRQFSFSKRFSRNCVCKNQNIYKYRALQSEQSKQLKYLKYTANSIVTPKWKWDKRLRMQSPWGLGISLPFPLGQYQGKYREIYWGSSQGQN